MVALIDTIRSCLDGNYKECYTGIEIAGLPVIVGYAQWHRGFYIITKNPEYSGGRSPKEREHLFLSRETGNWMRDWDHYIFPDALSTADVILQFSATPSPELATYDELDQQE